MEKSKFTHTIVSQRFTRLFALLVILIGLLVLFGWFSGLMFLTRFSINEVPMAPSTAYVFVFMAVGLWFYLRPQKIASNRNAAIAFAVIAICLSCLIVITNGLKYYANWEHVFIKIPETQLSMQLGHMSLVTAILFIISGFALLFLLSKRKIVKTFSIILTLIILIISFILLLAYGFGAPFFYFDNFIPPAVLTVLSFLLVSLALIAASDKNTFFVKSIWETSTSAKLLRIFLPTTIAITVVESLIIIRILPLLNIHPAIGVSLVSFIVVAVVIVVISIISKSMGKALDTALENLSESEAKFKTLVTNNEEIIYMIDKNGIFQLSEGKGLSTLSMKSGQVVGESVFDIYKDYPEMLVDIRKTLNGESMTVEHKVGDIYFSNWYTPHKNSSGEIIGLLGLSVDITERKQMEEKLRESEKFSKEILESMSDGFSILDENGVHIDVNLAFCKMTGFAKEELIGVGPPHPYWPEEEYGKIQEAFVKTAQGNFESFELVFKKKNGNRFPVLVNPSQIKDDQGNVVSNFASVVDITERKHAEEALLQSEATIKNKLKAITEPDGDIGTLELSDIIDTEALQSMMENFYQLTGMLGAVLDISGKVLVAVGWQDICTKFHRCNPYSLKNCIESDTILTRGVAEGTFKAYHCKNHMWDIVTPIMVGGRHLGNVFMGQYFLEDELPDYEIFREQARKYGFDEREYLAALDRVPRFSQETVDAGMQFYSKLASIISTLSFSTIQQSRMLSERKLAEEALRESEAKLSALFSSLTEMVVMHELVLNDAGEAIDYRIIDCNKVFTEFTGISKKDALGKLATEVYQTDTPPFLEEYSKVGLSGEPHEFTSFYSPLDKHLMISVVSPQHGKFATITTDITPMMRIQETIMAKNKEMENYLYVASHDLRTPLVNIQGFSQRLKKQAESIKTLFADKTLEPEILHQLGIITDEAIPKTLSFILSGIEKMDALINGLLQLSRTGRVAMNIQKIDVNALFAQILQSLDFQIKEAHCKIHINPLPACYGDAALLDQLFANIIINALKYADLERALEITVDAKNTHNRLVYTISDNGKGIAQKHLDKIWDIFYRIDPRSGKTGEGIGLSLVKQIAEKHKGKVWVESVENEGSIFHIELHNGTFTEV